MNVIFMGSPLRLVKRLISTPNTPPSQAVVPGLAKAVGLLVLDVEGSSPAEGILQPKDVILEVNGHPARSAAEVSAILATQKSGEATLLVISRNAATMLVPIEMPMCVQE
jgi:S1-C subfamily serine protease